MGATNSRQENLATRMLLKNSVRPLARSIKSMILRSSWRKLGQWKAVFGLCIYLNLVLRGCRAWVVRSQVRSPWLLVLPLPAQGAWPCGPNCWPQLPGTPPGRSDPAPYILRPWEPAHRLHPPEDLLSPFPNPLTYSVPWVESGPAINGAGPSIDVLCFVRCPSAPPQNRHAIP